MDAIGLSSVSHYVSGTLTGTRVKEFLNSYLTNPVDLVKYLGIVFLLLMFFHLFRFRGWNRKAAILWVPIISYLILFMIIFGVGSDIRYAIPIFPYLVVFFAQPFLSLGKKWRFIVVGVCVLQFISTTYYVHQKRQISSEVRDGFEYIRKNVPQKALILYPEENLLIYTQHRFIWSRVLFFRNDKKLSLESVFWPKDLEEMGRNLDANRIDHILVKKSRVYDDHEERHFGGYPKSFVEKLPQLDGWVKVFENPGVALWKKVPS